VDTAAPIVEAFRSQARTAHEMGSALVGALLERVAEDLAAGGPAAELVAGWRGHPLLDNLPLRLMGAVHREVLAGRAPALAGFFPSVGGSFEPEGAWKALRALLADEAPRLRAALEGPVQTNEVRRCCALLGGFLEVAARTGLPLGLLEIGASAGLNLRFDRYRYRLGPHAWGDPDAALALDTAWSGPPPALGAPLRVVGRAGCDLRPVRVGRAEERLRLLSFIWPDQAERLERVGRAAELAAADPPPVAAARARDWLEAALAAAPEGRATVLYHSVMWWYLPEEERRAVTALVRAAGARATTAGPLAWLRMEGTNPRETEIRLWTWPGDADRRLGRAHYHGAWVAWEPDGDDADEARDGGGSLRSRA